MVTDLKIGNFSMTLVHFFGALVMLVSGTWYATTEYNRINHNDSQYVLTLQILNDRLDKVDTVVTKILTIENDIKNRAARVDRQIEELRQEFATAQAVNKRRTRFRFDSIDFRNFCVGAEEKNAPWECPAQVFRSDYESSERNKE